MRRDNEKLDFDDTETAEDLHEAFVSEYGNLSDEELDELFEKTFARNVE